MERTWIFKHTHFNGDKTVFLYRNCLYEDAYKNALREGWYPPKWFQFWRCKDKHPKKVPQFVS